MTFRAARHDPRCKSIQSGTFHSFANLIIREHADVLGIPPQFRILDSADSVEAIRRCCPDHQQAQRGRLPKPETLRAILSKSINTNLSIEQIIQSDYSFFGPIADQVIAIGQAYSRFKRETGCLDFDDLIVLLRQLLGNESIRHKLAARYSHIMVDEYQDTNAIEAQVTCLLGSVHRNLMIVGDDAQSIYRFRGADYRNILAFPEGFPGCRIIKLEQNYRSTQAILDLANAVLAGMRHKYSKCLQAADGVAGEKPVLAKSDGELSEAQWVADQIRRNRAAGVDLHRQAVLYRSLFMSDSLQLVLRERRVPFRVVGGPRVMDLPHVKAFMACLRVLVDRNDPLAWHRLLMTGGLGRAEAERCSAAMRRGGSLGEAVRAIGRGVPQIAVR